MVIEVIALIIAAGIGFFVGVESQKPRIKRLISEIDNVWERFFDEENKHFETKNKLEIVQAKASKKKTPVTA